MNLIFILIVILVCIHLFWPKSEHFRNYDTWNQDYESLTNSNVANQIDAGKDFYKGRAWISPSAGYNYANTIAADLDKPFASPMGGPSWDPSSYSDVQMPDGQFVGVITPN